MVCENINNPSSDSYKKILRVPRIWTIQASIIMVLFFLNTPCVFALAKKIILVEEANKKFKYSLGAKQIEEIANTDTHKNEARDGYDAHFAMSLCFDVMKYYYTGGGCKNKPIFFRLHRPRQVEPGKKYPLIITFHGGGEGRRDNNAQLAHFHYGMKHFIGSASVDFYCIATQCPYSEQPWFSPDEEGDSPMKITMKILDVFLEEYPIDQDKISLLGICSGGTAAWDLACRQPDRFAAIVTCSSSGPSDLQATSKLTSTAIWAFNNTFDNMSSIESCRLAINCINQNGGLAYLDETPINGHDSWTRALRDEDAGAFKWLAFQNQNTVWPVPGHLPQNPPRSPATNARLFFLPLGLIGILLYAIKKK